MNAHWRLAPLLVCGWALAGGAQTDPEVGVHKEDFGDDGPAPTKEDLGAVPAPPVQKKPPQGRVEKSAVDPLTSSPISSPISSPTSSPPPAPAAVVTSTVATPTRKKSDGPAAPTPEQVDKAARLLAELDAALRREPCDPKALETLVGFNVTDAHLAAEPLLRATLRLAKGRLALAQGRWDDAQAALADARAVIDPGGAAPQRRLASQWRYRQAELQDARGRATKTCGQELGLSRLSAFESKVIKDRLKNAAAKYRQAIQGSEPFWSRRAAYRTAALYEATYRSVLTAPRSLRAVKLPNPFTVATASTATLTGDLLTGAWPQEMTRLYTEVAAAIDAREPDEVLATLARDSADALSKVRVVGVDDTATNPYLDAQRPGLLRVRRGLERLGDAGWSSVPVDGTPAAKDALRAAVAAGPGDVQFAYALAGLAELNDALSEDILRAALSSQDSKVRLAALVAIERAPQAGLLDAIVKLYVATPVAAQRTAFTTLQGALFGEPERALLALRALAAKERALADTLLQDERLPLAERVWLVAELQESRLVARLQALAWNNDPVVASRAIFALYLTQGKNALGYARPQADGVVGCVSRAVHAMAAP